LAALFLIVIFKPLVILVVIVAAVWGLYKAYRWQPVTVIPLAIFAIMVIVAVSKLLGSIL
jgi:hypothetical protein